MTVESKVAQRVEKAPLHRSQASHAGDPGSGPIMGPLLHVITPHSSSCQATFKQRAQGL